MAYRLIWSPLSRDDLREIVRYIARDDQDRAAAFGLRLIKRVELLPGFPEMGRMVPERGDPEVREIIVRPYRVIYRVEHSKQLIEVIRVWHGARGDPKMA